ncbi:MAG: prepilin-type N-terminal cleavage/methylation domain-containing protein, partial [Deltaproteobacteria bacterium]|nr:prepilin-type N-terminal cleavage/methylation domain-containing protein [Deltaproteobacteria bacterium]
MTNKINTRATAACKPMRKTKRLSNGVGGFTLIELLIAILLAGLAATAVYSLYNNFFRQTSTQDMMLEAQQNARVAINAMERELMNAGYAAGTPDIITVATANSVEFIYTDPETDPTMSATAGRRLKVRYSLQTDANGVQYLVRKADDITAGTIVGNTYQVIPYVNNLAIAYYGIDGSTIADTTTQASRNTVRFVSINLVTRTKANAPGTAAPKTFMVETHIRLRNIGVGSTATDTTAPAAPAGLQVRDPGLCGRLKVKWTKNTEGDLAGYKIYYGTASGNYTGVINVPLTVMSGSTYSCANVGSSVECTIFPNSPALDYTPSNAVTATTYYLAVKAFDNSLNHSGFSAEASGNPAVSNPTFDAGVNDSTLNPVKPVAVTGLTGANGAVDRQVALSWTGYNTATNPDVTGFRIYRSTAPFTSYPIDPTQPNIDWIAGEPGSGKPTVAVGATSYTDVGPGLLGCKTYYYAIAPVNCDATLITDEGGDPASKKYVQTDYGATCGDGTAACSAGTGFPSVAGSDTAPGKTTPPASPVLSVRAGWKRVALSLTQPADPDLSQTCVYSNLGITYPSLQTNTGMFPKTL